MNATNDLSEHTPLGSVELDRIRASLEQTGVFTTETLQRQMTWFFRDLGIDAYYFQTTPTAEIARHVLALSASELVSRHGGEGVNIQLISEEATRATYIVEDTPRRIDEVERRMEARYPSFRLESYRTRPLPDGNALRFYVATRPQYPGDATDASASQTEARPSISDPGSRPAAQPSVRGSQPDTFESSVTTGFLERSLPATVERYRSVWEELSGQMAPVIRITRRDNSEEQRVMIGLHTARGRSILSTFTTLFRVFGLEVNRRYIEPFRNNRSILTFYTPVLDAARQAELSRELSSAAMLPDIPLRALFTEDACSAQETMYAIAAAAFAHQFVSELAEGYQLLAAAVADSPEARGILASLKSNLTKNTFSTARIASTVRQHHRLVGRLFAHFGADAAERASIRAELEEEFDHEVPYHRDRTILNYFLRFNELVVRTNLYRDDNVALSFRMGHGFLDREDYPEEPFGVFFMVGREFTGFHVRFRDIARGGIRIVRSRSADAWGRNVDTIFEENYNLAATQQRKNKDIPEGGSKGIILVNPEFGMDSAAAEQAFRSYVDALLDILVGEQPAGLSGAAPPKEVLFLGPDEGSAGLMDWAALHARERGYPFWKSLTTGKSLSLGGVPHDRYGMTTRSVHTYARRLMEELGLEESGVTKIQTGGPDGDLGSNEILISRDRTIAIVDGSGVLYDPAGLDRDELSRLARERQMVSAFDRSRLGAGGFLVGIDDRDVELPDGSVHPNGEEFRNRFHVSPWMQADLFVPCGGRPSAINVANWTALLNEDGSPRLRAIVEGANLFITQEARLRLEERGVIIFKDASTNKGGVTSSSLEVFAGLALSDEEFQELMTLPDPTAAEPPFRQAYVAATIARIEANAAAEFDLMWQEHRRSGRPLTLLSDDVSRRINTITDAVHASDYRDDMGLRQTVVAEYTPAPLLEQVGLEAILKRVPDSYLDAIVASHIGSRFVYRYGLEATEVDFARYLDELRG